MENIKTSCSIPLAAARGVKPGPSIWRKGHSRIEEERRMFIWEKSSGVDFNQNLA
jgi:hypothetical protein